MAESLDPTLVSRFAQLLHPDWMRTVAARRFSTGALVILAGIAALRPDPDGQRIDVVVAARDLSPATALNADDVRLEKRLLATVPEGSQTDLATVDGVMLAGPARRGEILTDLRLLGPRLADAAAGPNARIVPVHLADTGLIDVIRPGDVVDILAAPNTDSVAAPQTRMPPTVVATDAVVVSVSPQPSQPAGRDRVVLVALPAATAHAVAGAALVQPVTFTLH